MDAWNSVRDQQLWERAEWHIEVLADNHMDLGPAAEFTTQIVCPTDYATPNQSLFKARALHYCSLHHQLHKDAWVLHMDEEG